MSRQTLYRVCGVLLVPPAALAVALVTRFAVVWPFALAASVALGFALDRPRREVTIVAVMSAVVAFLLAAVFLLLVWTGLVGA